ncbi:hypothetical protein TsFJ059_008673 [Trichoderma semiorbis]|uniref:Uncharacterized protein n=1 Tax=Trichoderma semiorbis TaxID=1491008 RepID=A0A9P8HA91_9HYPO|nr:hypothetical protein TsFJ059_008673 [Trichoderma semiorbis]
MMAQRLLLQAGRQSMATIAANNVARASLGLRFSSTAPYTIVEGSFWRSLIPKPMRKANRNKLKAKAKKEWNPATYFIVMFLFIGSMSIQMIALRNQTERYMRQSALRIAQLREVVQRIQNGEDVDVEKLLGTGDAQKETEWEEVLQAIERDEASRNPEKQPKQKQTESQAKMTSHPESSAQQVQPEAPVKAKTASFGNFF